MEQEIVACLSSTLSLDGSSGATVKMKAATEKLKALENSPDYIPSLMRVLGRLEGDAAVLQACSTLFKNLVRLHWVSNLLIHRNFKSLGTL